ncbi:hypothetical protein [Novosphingobium guangzhouense]|uniref:Uncharacterized protein n=1 Tax=Novosphingobium guangzhouense TaxID=1850347 RepID=A0A2K2G428_9SPHN|nr:hypothetical protein [Novosphingobium guangzhouense]PNU05799.1 hypothetical protein A8V01_14625 [Novosphingobium guangzhouense]
MKWLGNLLTSIKSELFAMVGVLAVCGIGAGIVGWMHIQRQDDQLATRDAQISRLAEANKNWGAWERRQNQLRDLEQRNVLLLQDKLALIQSQNAAAAMQLQKLRDENAEVREYMSRPIPAELRRLLNAN